MLAISNGFCCVSRVNHLKTSLFVTNETKKEVYMSKSKVVKRGQKQPFTSEQIAAIATVVGNSGKVHALRDIALLRVAVDTMLRGSDLVRLTVGSVMWSGSVLDVLEVTQKKTAGLVKCALTPKTREALAAYIASLGAVGDGKKLFPITTRQFRNIVKGWCEAVNLDARKYGGHSLRRTKARIVYQKTGNLAIVQKLLGHSNLWHTQRYLGVTEADALDAARGLDV
jgi:integrase